MHLLAALLLDAIVFLGIALLVLAGLAGLGLMFLR